MSAIKKRFTVYLPVLLLLIFSCSDKAPQNKKTEEALQYIIYSKVGGKEGYYKTIKVTRDSIILDTGKTSANTHRFWKTTLTKTDAERLFSTIKIYQLPFIKSSESLQFKNGTDETFRIKTVRTSYVFVNAYTDAYNYRQLNDFKNRLAQLLPKEYRPL